MKILMISNHLGVQSGVQRYVQNLLLNLDLTRYQVDLFVGLCPPDQASCAPALEAAGVQNNVPDYMNAFDLFLLPSNFEGSPVTLVEAQGCGVPCLASTNVPGDGSVTELVHFLPLSAPFEEWAKTADSIAPGGPHTDYWPTLAAAGYELKTAAHRMEQVYDKVAGEGAR